MLTYKPVTNNAVQEIELIKYLLNKLKLEKSNQSQGNTRNVQYITITSLYTGGTGTKSVRGGTG